MKAPTEPADATHPFALGPGHLFNAARRIVARTTTDNLMIVAAGVAFYGLLGLFPAMGALVAGYGILSDPADLREVTTSLRGVLPGDVIQLLVDQLESITSSSDSSLSTGAIVAVLVSIWSANKATKALFTGLNIAYREQEERGFITLNLVSLGTTASVLVAAILGVTTVTALPFAVGDGLAVDVLRWSLLGGGMLALLSVLYRFGPDRRHARWQWVTVGSIGTTLVWLIGCIGFSLYVEMFGTYNETFGALGAVAILLTWMWISAFLVMLGAQTNAELEYETVRDSTAGETRPRGHRGAFVADNVPDDYSDAIALQTSSD